MLNNLLAVLAVSSLLCACSHSRSVTTRNGSVTVDQAKDGAGSAHVVTKDGISGDFNTGNKITDYPGDVPLYDGTSTMDVKSPQKHVRVVVLETSDPIEKISSFYKSQFDSKGWKVEATINNDKAVLYKAVKDNRQTVVSIASEDGKQKISQTLGDK